MHSIFTGHHRFRWGAGSYSGSECAVAPGNAWRGVLGIGVLQAFLVLALAQDSRKPQEPTLQKTRLSHQPTGACVLEVASSALCPFLAVLGEAHPNQGAQLAESTWDFLAPKGGRFLYSDPESGHLPQLCLLSLPRED